MPAALDVGRRLLARVPRDVVRAIPYAVVLAVALGITVVLGAHLSHAWPSRARPYGLPGPASFEYAVAFVRPDLVLATTLPAVLLGARALEDRWPARDRVGAVAGVAGAHGLVLVGGVLLAALIGVWGAKRTPGEAFVAFFCAHALLALAFYAVGFAWAASLRKHAVAAAFLTWSFFVLFYDSYVKLRVLREVGLPGLENGGFPSWFYVAQAISPLTLYRGILILWRENFRDGIERAMLGDAVLPAWLNPGVFASVLALLWIALPLGAALVVWRIRAARAARAPEPMAASTIALR